MKRTYLLGIGATAAVLGLLLTTAPLASAEEGDEGRLGKIVRIGKDVVGNEEVEEEVIIVDENGLEGEAVAAPSFWIGVSGRGVENPILRTHLQLAEDMGVVVEAVVDDSPAAKAGLRRHDIVLRANGEAVHNMRVLQEIVSAGGGAPIELKIIRLGKEKVLTVTPEERPADASNFSGRRRGRVVFGDNQRDLVQRMLEQFQQPGALDRFGAFGAGREFGPGVLFGGRAQESVAMPNGVAITLQKQGEQPTRATVRQGDKTWTVEAGDDEAIEKLPEELRPHVRQMLDNAEGRFGAMRFDFDMSDFDMGDFMKDFDMSDFQVEAWKPPAGEAQPRGRAGAERRVRDEVLERMEALERQLQELRERLGEEDER